MRTKLVTCKFYGALDVYECVTRFVDANAFDKKGTPCYKCEIGLRTRRMEYEDFMGAKPSRNGAPTKLKRPRLGNIKLPLGGDIIVSYVMEHGTLTSGDVQRLLNISQQAAHRKLASMTKHGLLVVVGHGRYARGALLTKRWS